MAIVRGVPVSAATAASRRAVARSTASGFSHITGTPARSSGATTSGCVAGGEATTTRSKRSGSASSATGIARHSVGGTDGRGGGGIDVGHRGEVAGREPGRRLGVRPADTAGPDQTDAGGVLEGGGHADDSARAFSTAVRRPSATNSACSGW